jgi:hypothetical protein
MQYFAEPLWENRGSQGRKGAHFGNHCSKAIFSTDVHNIKSLAIYLPILPLSRRRSVGRLMKVEQLAEWEAPGENSPHCPLQITRGLT